MALGWSVGHPQDEAKALNNAAFFAFRCLEEGCEKDGAPLVTTEVAEAFLGRLDDQAVAEPDTAWAARDTLLLGLGVLDAPKEPRVETAVKILEQLWPANGEPRRRQDVLAIQNGLRVDQQEALLRAVFELTQFQSDYLQ